MSKKLHPLAVAFRAADALSDDEKTALRDYLRPAPKPRQKATAAKCKHCQKTATAAVHVAGSNRYGHPFESGATASGGKSAQKRKAGKEVEPVVVTKFDGNCAECRLPFDDNVHHRKSDSGYHEFVPVDENRAVSSTKTATGGEQ